MVDDALDTIVMRKLQAVLGHQINDLTVWLDKSYGTAMQERIDDAQVEVDRLRQWALSQPDKEIREAYIGWLDNYYQRGLDDARLEMRTHRIQKEHEQYDAENERRRHAVTNYNRDVPEPPRS